MKKLFLIFALSFLAIPLMSSASGFRGTPAYTLGKDAIADKNLYVVSNSVSILGTAKEDMVAVAGNVMILGDVGKDLNAVGGTLVIESDIGDDARLVGGTLTIGGKIGGELLAAGGQINLNSGLKIDSDVKLAGGNILINGIINGDLVVYGGTVRIDGKVNGDVSVTIDENLVIGGGAEINGDLKYSAPEKLTIEDGAKINGKTTFAEIAAPRVQAGRGGFFGFLGAAWLIGLLISLAAALAVYFLLGDKLKEALDYTMSNFGRETLRGFIILVALPIAVIISFITVIGILLGVAGTLLYVVMVVFASIFAPILLGTLIFRKFMKKPEFTADWKSVLMGVVVIKIVDLVPFVGWIFTFIFFLAAFGTLFNYLYRHFKKV